MRAGCCHEDITQPLHQRIRRAVDPAEDHWTQTYWWGERPDADAPLTAWVPFFALHRMRSGYRPATHSVALQRSVSRTFRREALLCRQPGLPAGEATSTAEDVYQVRGAVREAVTTWPDGQAARLVGRLGLHEQAWGQIRRVPLHSGNELVMGTLLDQVAISHYLVASSTSTPFLDAIGALAHRLDQHPSAVPPEQVRPAALGAVKATVHYGTSNDAASCAWWAGHATELGRRYDGPEFEALLLHTRIDRAKAFLPHLHGRLDSLISAARALLDDAARLTALADGPDEVLMARENRLAVYETTSRMFEGTGDDTTAHQVLETAADQVDPADPKIRLHLGDFHHRRGETQRALVHFIAAGALDAPYSRIGWYRAGFLLQNQQRHHDAIGAYLLSLSYWPEGTSAHAGIVRSARRIGLPEDDYRFARTALERTIAAPESERQGAPRG
ncbi:tetratricopeptide repeat protein [Lipingzhangella sp. LS1_29]|uniref:Tetratricopeptide repeat protein n=1 Tax=Lipingzhangella rawalii TaxID=2055835 RepID=A0ABU2H2K5_9ACTN|nr:tetratricopeptide repeat protein [Lipingzhangella rawalii]MDS1269100.1 tetratricopeptide repeat protein [Lipingzhangella rawalii]